MKSDLNIPTLKQVEHELCRRSYEEYAAYTHKTMYVRSKFTHFITNKVQDFIEKKTDNAYDILAISVPSQQGKSMNITETLPSWLMGKYPRARIIMASYNETFASKFLRRNRAKINEYGSEIFGLKITKDSSEEIENSENGSIISKGLLGGITGNPGEFVIIDDPIKNRQDADSPTIRETLHEEWMNSVKSRLGVGAKVIVIQTRWHQQDLIGYLLENEEHIEYVKLPIECLTDTDEMGRVYGELLVPEIGRDRKWWDSFKKSFANTEGTRALNSIYYCNPSNEEGGIFKRAWFEDNLYTTDPTKTRYKLLPRIMHTVISVDATFKDTKKSDFVAIQVWGKSGQGNYLLSKVKRRMGFTETIKVIQEIIGQYPEYNAILVEDKANGSAIVEVLSRTYRSVIPVEPYGSKEARASAVSPMLEAGNVHILDIHGSLIEEAVDFPNSEHDDEVDCMTQALNRLRNVFADIPVAKDEYDIDYDDELNDILSFGN
jgi:predicted phage terminase large subunit-like protein